MRPEDEKAATHLTRLGVNPVTVQRLAGWAEAEDESLRDLVRYVLSDYAPAIILTDNQDAVDAAIAREEVRYMTDPDDPRP